MSVAAFAILGFMALQGNRSTDNRSQASEETSGFVRADGTQFQLGSKQFKFIGFNLFDAAGSVGPYSCVQTNGWWTKFSNGELNTAFKTMKTETGATVLRFWAFQKYTKGGTDFSGIDNVIQLAKINGFKVLPVLEDGPGYCTEPGGGGNGHQAKWQYQGDTWYTDGYKVVNPGNTLSYRDYVKTIVTRYKDEPTIFAWMLTNEADTSKKVTVNGKAQSALVGFATDMGNVVKAADPNHLLTVGTQSNGASGATGQDFLDVYGISTIDFADAHDWGYWGGETQSLPGAAQNTDGSVVMPNPLSADCLKTYQGKIGCSLAQATQILKKPMIFSESGVSATDASSRQRRAELMNNKMKAFFENQGAGYIYWQWNKVLDGEHFDVQANTNDPLLPTMKKYAGLPILPLDQVISISPIPTILPTVLPSLKPTLVPTPVATIKPTPVPSPTPIQISPRPSSGPYLNGAEMILKSGTGKIINDAAATSKQGLLMESNGSATGYVQGPISKLTLSLKPGKCSGSPHVNVKLNGQYVLDKNLDADGYQNYEITNLARFKLGQKAYPIEIIFNNDSTLNGCSKSVTIDRVSVN